MEKNYWHSRWHNNEIGFNQLSPNILLQKFFSELALKAGSRVFVPLCGKSIDMLWLVDQGMHVVGVELSESACQEFFEENQLPFYKEINDEGFMIFINSNITLYAGDFFALTCAHLGEIDAVYDRAALIALPDELRASYVAHLKKIIPNHTPILLITSQYNQEEMPGPPFSVELNEVNRLFGDAQEVLHLYEKLFSEIPSHLYQKGLRHAYEHVFKIAR